MLRGFVCWYTFLVLNPWIYPFGPGNLPEGNIHYPPNLSFREDPKAAESRRKKGHLQNHQSINFFSKICPSRRRSDILRTSVSKNAQRFLGTNSAPGWCVVWCRCFRYISTSSLWDVWPELTGGCYFCWCATLPETHISPLKMSHPKRKGSSSNHPFSGAMIVFGGVPKWGDQTMQMYGKFEGFSPY